MSRVNPPLFFLPTDSMPVPVPLPFLIPFFFSLDCVLLTSSPGFRTIASAYDLSRTQPPPPRPTPFSIPESTTGIYEELVQMVDKHLCYSTEGCWNMEPMRIVYACEREAETQAWLSFFLFLFLSWCLDGVAVWRQSEGDRDGLCKRGPARHG
jgi:hypothetical protein